MLSTIKRWLGIRPLDYALNETKTVYIKGVRFALRKLNPLDHMSGAKVMLQYYETYRNANTPQQQEISSKKLKEHYADTFMSGVVYPKLSREKDVPYTTFVEDLFNNWDLAQELYNSIHEYTYGKKKQTFLN